MLLFVSLALADSPSETQAVPCADVRPDLRRACEQAKIVRVNQAPGHFVTELPGDSVSDALAGVPGVVVDRYGLVRESRGATPTLYVDGIRWDRR